MATFTANYNLRKPAGTDLVTVASDINASMDTLDTEIKALDTDLYVHKARVSKASQTITTSGSAVDWDPDTTTYSRGITVALAANTLTIARAGHYSVAFGCLWALSNTGIRGAILLNNGVEEQRDMRTIVNTTNFATNLIFEDSFAAGDVLKIQVFQSSGAAQDLTNSWLSVKEIP